MTEITRGLIEEDEREIIRQRIRRADQGIFVEEQEWMPGSFATARAMLASARNSEARLVAGVYLARTATTSGIDWMATLMMRQPQ